MAEPLGTDNPERDEQYRRFVSQAKQEAKNGNLEESLCLLRKAHQIYPCEKLTRKMKKVEEALASLALDQEDDVFVDVCQSGLMLFGEIHDKLFDHQREGVAFLYSLYRDGRKGGILADDMGLGKTIQIIAFLSGMFDEELIRTVLLIMPPSLLSNWLKEFAKWTPGLRVSVFHGPNKYECERNLKRIQKRSGILLTTYQLVLSSWQQLSSFDGKEFVWDYVILDEAHKIKTPSAKTTKSVHAIPSQNRILLTGTPVQNNLKELWALFDFACQGSLLGTMKTFGMEYEKPIIRARTKNATQEEKALGLKISENLMSIIKPYFLRRSKDELQNKAKPELKISLPEYQSKTVASEMPSLPRKNDFIVWVYLSPIQKEIYRDFLSLDHIQKLLMTTRSPLAELNVLKKLCDHPRLLSAQACSKLGLEAPNYNMVDGDENNEPSSMKRNLRDILDETLMAESGKLSFLMALLERLQEEGHRTLVFSHSRKMLDIIERILTHRCFKLMRIDGTVSQLEERKRRISVFQKSKEYSVFLLTTQVGGVGLTLTAATRVVIFDPSWNPATDAQAVDRVYRIGQKDNVVIYRLISCGTVEEKIYRRQVFKDSLIRQSMGDRKDPYRYFTMQELRELFTLGDTQSSVTQLQLQSLHASQRKTDKQLDKHIAYLHSLDIFGISDHDLMYTHEAVHGDEVEDEEVLMDIEHRVQKAQELVQLESQLKDQLMGNLRNTTEGAWLRDMELSTQPNKKPSKPSPNYALVPPVTDEPASSENISLVGGSDDDIVNVSSKMTELLIEEDEQVLQNITNMDISASMNEECKPASPQEVTPISSFTQDHSLSYKENCSPACQVASHDPPAEANGKFNDAQVAPLQQSFHYVPDDDLQTTQNHDQSHVSSSSQAHLSFQVNCSSELQTICHDPPVEANGMLTDIQGVPLQQSSEYVSNHVKQQGETDMSLNIPTSPHGEAGEVAEPGASEASQLQTSKMSDLSFAQKSGMSVIMVDEALSGSPQCDFRLVLEDSEDQLQDISGVEMSLKDTENTRFPLNGHCSSWAHSWLQENSDNRSLQASKSIMGSMVIGGSDDVLMNNSELSFQHKNMPVKIIVSDSEEDDDCFITDWDDSKHRQESPTNKLPDIMSTPKSKLSTTSLCFSPRIIVSGRRSTASRKSLASILLDQVEDIAETIESTSYMSCEDSFKLYLEAEKTLDYCD
ncbi:DNA excision repair protein ERCC-6-like [Podarcis raffonei]|uniref:DNA excision repair protein ERCC-6-like n=1 Tax=Podarcis raffonei TaxID=65483 RepID=UPI00232979B1|nr:DNA excision repair protein ERCC-6-like [Podarcis raffonei]